MDAAWRERAVVAARPELAADVAAELPAITWVHADEAAHPDLALRLRWALRVFHDDAALPHVSLWLPITGNPRLRLLYAGTAGSTTEGAMARRLSQWTAEPAGVAAEGRLWRRALVHSARRGWRAALDLRQCLGAFSCMILDVVRSYEDRLLPGLRPQAYQLLLVAAGAGSAPAASTVRMGLSALARSPLRDPLDGAFYQGTPDRPGAVPTLARTAEDHAALLVLYSRAARTLEVPRAPAQGAGAGPAADPSFADVARDCARYLLDSLRDPATGGFRASQGAVEAYYGWTSSEALAALPYDVVQVAFLHWNVQPRGGRLADPSRNLLAPTRDVGEIARLLDLSPTAVAAGLGTAREALLAARARRPAPSLDDALYVDVNAQVVSALLAGAAMLGEPGWATTALQTLDWLESHCFQDGTAHVPHRVGPEGTAGGPYLSDHATLGHALLDAHAHTGDARYLTRAETVAAVLVGQFRKPRGGALLDVPADSLTARAFWPEQPLEDGTWPSPASEAARLLVRLARAHGHTRYEELAAEALRAGAWAASHEPVDAAGYYLALAELLGPEVLLS